MKMTCCWLVSPTGRLGKLRDERVPPVLGEVRVVEAAPVPVKLTVCGLVLALSVKVSEALRVPVADGVNVTLTVQVLLGASVAPVQVSALLAKALAFVPPSADEAFGT